MQGMFNTLHYSWNANMMSKIVDAMWTAVEL